MRGPLTATLVKRKGPRGKLLVYLYTGMVGIEGYAWYDAMSGAGLVPS